MLIERRGAVSNDDDETFRASNVRVPTLESAWLVRSWQHQYQIYAQMGKFHTRASGLTW
jgi:hypothetical protein